MSHVRVGRHPRIVLLHVRTTGCKILAEGQPPLVVGLVGFVDRIQRLGLPPPRQQDAKVGENLAALATGPEMVVVAKPTNTLRSSQKNGPAAFGIGDEHPPERDGIGQLRLSPAEPKEENMSFRVRRRHRPSNGRRRSAAPPQPGCGWGRFNRRDRGFGGVAAGGDHRSTYRALRSVLHVLRNRLTPEQAVHLRAQLPLLVRGILYDG